MPDMTTHFMFGEQVQDDLNPSLRKIVSRRQAVFNLGQQGPDLLFFRKGKLSTTLPRLGSMIHKQKTENLLQFCRDYLHAISPGEEQEIITAYLCGFYCHYFLDSTAHPYVYYLTEMRKGSEGYSVNESAVHAEIEAEIDCIFYRLFHTAAVREFRPKNQMAVEHGEKTVIAKFYVELLSSVYGVHIPIGEVIKCFQDILTVSNLFYGKGRLLRVAGRVVGIFSTYGDAVLAQHKPELVATDTANFCENKWHHPKYLDETYNCSVLSLFQEAKGKAVSAINAVFSSNEQTDGPLPFDTSRNFAGNRWAEEEDAGKPEAI